MTRLVLALALALTLPLPAMTAQNLVPSPYPSISPGSTSLTSAPPSAGGTQTYMGSPYPQATGAGSQANPPILGTDRGRQTVRSTYTQKYGVQQK